MSDSSTSQYQIADQLEPSVQESSRGDKSSLSGDGSGSLGDIQESHILQERKIGVWGSISLIVNKIIGAGYVFFSGFRIGS